MCGICGIVDFASNGEDFSHKIDSMVDVLRHRGPDGRGMWRCPSAALGHARLSIIDLSEGKQPMSNEDGTVWITYNGEIYNFKQIRGELEAAGHVFRTKSDTEVIVHLYEQEGIDCVRRLRGIFAFGIWDSRCNSMYLVRDHLGVKPLYYTVHNGRLIFASEIKGILAHGGVPREVWPEALSDYLTFLYVPAPKTMFKNIYKLPAAHWLRFNAAGDKVSRYWDLPHKQAWRGTRQEAESRLVETLGECVGMQLVSDVPLGAFLSGGVDSSSVVAMMATAGQSPLITTSIGFNERKYSELQYARRVARQFRTVHHEQIIEPDAASVVEKLSWHYDEPFADYSSIPTFYVSQAARKHVTVVLSGDGGDENFGGYRRYWFDLAERRARRLIPRFMRRWVLEPIACIYPKADWLPKPLRAKSTLGNICVDAPEAYCRSVGVLRDAAKPAFFSSDITACLNDYRSADVIRSHMEAAPSGNDLDQLIYTDLKTFLVDDILAKVDRASMAVGLEVRVPLLDYTMVEFAWSVPSHWKIEGNSGKAIFKSAMSGMLDRDLLYRPKQGFTPPIKEWLRGPLRDMAGDMLLGSSPRYADYIRPAAVRWAWNAHQSALRNNEPLLWAVLMFEMWARRFLAP
ncbi:MAG: asparagine synthase (glutamine-hydrolyzing) [Planctomycetes bacterium]|nr:asparagine synthase (glutamine-hydrolyzing) [Planctomycetota bacterium]